MRYHFIYRNNAKDFWIMRYYNLYPSLAGVVNIVFTFSSIALATAKWMEWGFWGRACLLGMMLLFPVFQPCFIYLASMAEAEKITMDTALSFMEKTVSISYGEQAAEIPWNQMYGYTCKKHLIAIYTDPHHGYILTERIVGKEEFPQFCAFVKDKMETYHKKA